MAEKLSITIFLDGAAEIERQLEGIGQAGTKAFEEIGKAAENVGGFDKLDLKDVTAKLEKFGVKGKAAIDKITAAVASAGRLERIVGGVRAVEDGFGKIGVAASAMSTRVVNSATAMGAAMTAVAGPVSRVARSFGLISRVGTGGLVVGLGAAAVAMEKTADVARVLESNLQAVFRNAAAGTAFFNQIQNAARTAGSSLESTGKAMLDIFKILQSGLKAKGISFAPGEGFKQTRDEAAQLFDTLQKGMQLSGVRADAVTKAIKALFAEISKNQPRAGDTFEQASQKAKAMADVLRKLAAEFPQLANELVKFLGTPGQSMEQLADQVEKGIRRIDIPKFINAVKRITPAVQTLHNAFDPTLAQRIDTISGAWNRLLDSFGKSPAGAGIKAAMDDIAKGLDEIAKKQEQVGKFTVEKPPETTTGKFLEQMFKEFDENIKIATANWNRLVMLVTTPIQAGADLWQWLLDSFDSVVNKIKQKAQELADFLKRILTQSPEKGGQLGGTGVPFLGGQIPPDVVARGAARIEDRRGEGTIDTTAINTALAQLATAAEQATISLQSLQGLEFSSIATAADSLNTAISSLADSMQSFSFSGMAEAFAAATAAAQQLGTDLQNLGLSEVAAAMQEVVFAANNAAQALSNIQAQGGGNFARGGLLGGRGTGTSDSNLAWVSRGEHIMPARAVRQPGVLAFLEALRRSGGSLRDVLDDMGRFALGGLVPRQPAFASGGLADIRGSGGRPIALTINAGGGERQTFHLWADEQVADSVLRYATKRQVASAGRKSGAFG